MKVRVTNGKRIRTIDVDKLSRAKKFGWVVVEEEVVEETDTEQNSEEEEI